MFASVTSTVNVTVTPNPLSPRRKYYTTSGYVCQRVFIQLLNALVLLVFPFRRFRALSRSSESFNLKFTISAGVRELKNIRNDLLHFLPPFLPHPPPPPLRLLLAVEPTIAVFHCYLLSFNNNNNKSLFHKIKTHILCYKN